MDAATPGPGWAVAARAATSRCCGAADCVADVTGQAVGGDDAEPGAGDDRDAGSLGALVQVVEGAEHLQLVADVEVVHSCAPGRLRRAGPRCAGTGRRR